MKIEENIYALESTKGSYAYLINDKEAILIDTGNPGKVKNILKEIESLNINPKNIKHILLTQMCIRDRINIVCMKSVIFLSGTASKISLKETTPNKSPFLEVI